MTPSARKRLPRRWPMGLAWVLWALALLSLPVVVWLDQLLRRAGLAELSTLQAANLLWILAGLSAATVGAVLASRRPDTRWAGCCSWPGCRTSATASSATTCTTG